MALWPAPLWAAAALVWFMLFVSVAIDRFGPILDDVLWFAIREGCIGSPVLFLGLAAAITAGSLYMAIRGQREGERRC
jgi:hypothetical protein